MNPKLLMIAAAAFALPASVSAADLWSSTTCPNTTNYSGYYTPNSSITCTDTAITDPVTEVSAWTASAGSNFAQATIGKWTGLGLGVSGGTEDTGNPQHSMDNHGKTDALLFHFMDNAKSDLNVALSSVQLGWSFNDSDISVLRYVGTSAPVMANFGLPVSGGLLAAGWALVSNLDDVWTKNSDHTATFNNGPEPVVSSSWWLISAYNAGYSTTAPVDIDTKATVGLDAGGKCKADSVGDSYKFTYTLDNNGKSCTRTKTEITSGTVKATKSDSTYLLANYGDYVKVLAVNGTVGPPNKTPEPAGLALVGLGLLGLMASRRRITK